MAEHVQAALDQMVAPLRDLMDRHIFTEEEIRAIVERRRESEYLLRRRAARKADFVRYIEAEMLLEKLRELRTTKRKKDHRKAQRAKGLDNDSNEKKDKEDHIGDVHIVQHIHLLFVRAIRKFRGDLSLHLQHAEFCKAVRSWTRLSRVYAEALQVFPREAGIWIEAASNEFFGPNRSVKSARILLQRALRLNGNSSEELWVQYFSLELHYAQTLKGRRKILNPNQEEKSEDDEQENSNEEDSDSDEIIDYNKIPMVILRNAIRSIPNSVEFRLKFLDVCQEFPDTTDLMEYVQQTMATDFANEPESWIARAIYQAGKRREKYSQPSAKRARSNSSNSNDPSDPVLSVLQEAIETLESNEMILQAFRFAEDYRRELDEQDNAVEEVDEFIRTLWTKAEKVNERKNKNSSSSSSSSELAMEHTRYLLRRGQGNEAIKTIRAHCVKKAATAEAWLLWARLTSSSIQKQQGILERALQSITMDTHPDYVIALLQSLGAELKLATREKGEDNLTAESQDAKLFGTLQKLLLLSPKTVQDVVVEPGSTGLDFEVQDVVSGYALCLEHFWDRKGIMGARKIYEAVLFQSTATSTVSETNVEQIQAFVDRCLELESKDSDDKTERKRKRTILRKLYDKAIDIFSGTPLEDSYREARSENAFFA